MIFLEPVEKNTSNSDTNFSTTRHMFEQEPNSSVHDADEKATSVQ